MCEKHWFEIICTAPLFKRALSRLSNKPFSQLFLYFVTDIPHILNDDIRACHMTLTERCIRKYEFPSLPVVDVAFNVCTQSPFFGVILVCYDLEIIYHVFLAIDYYFLQRYIAEFGVIDKVGGSVLHDSQTWSVSGQ